MTAQQPFHLGRGGTSDGDGLFIWRRTRPHQKQEPHKPLCLVDGITEDAFIAALQEWMNNQPTVHLRYEGSYPRPHCFLLIEADQLCAMLKTQSGDRPKSFYAFFYSEKQQLSWAMSVGFVSTEAFKKDVRESPITHWLIFLGPVDMESIKGPAAKKSA